MKKLNSVCLISQNVPELRNFYQHVLEVTAEGDDDFAEFSVPGINFSIFSTAGLEKMAPGLMDNGHIFQGFKNTGK